ncbi:MAG: DUF3817 domain-containing protein [Bacteroidetes bacterium]|nr:DUF3817 domain-containing protein [Bacteroidota bacterium]
MIKYFNSNIGLLRMIAFFEGLSLIVLMFIAVPLKHLMHDPLAVRVVGPIHGVLFVLFVLFTYLVASEKEWTFKSTTWKVYLSSLIPFGTFYIDHVFLKGLHEEIKP